MYNCITIGDIKLDTFVEVHDAKVKGDLFCLEYGKKIPAKIMVPINIDNIISINEKPAAFLEETANVCC